MEVKKKIYVGKKNKVYKKYNKKYNHNTYNKQRCINNSLERVLTSLHGQSAKVYCDFTIQCTVIATAYTGSTQFRGNAITTCDNANAVVPNQDVRGWGVLDSLYTDYTCFGSKCELVWQSPFTANTTTNYSYNGYLFPYYNGFIAGVTEAQATQMPHVKRFYINNTQVDHPVYINSNYISTSDVWGVTRASVRDNQATYGSPIAGTPTNLWYWNLYLFENTQQTYTVTNVNHPFRIKMTYYVRFQKKTILVQG